MPGQSDPVDLGHHDIGEQQIVFRIARAHEPRLAIADRIDRMARPPQPAGKESTHLIVVFGEENARHSRNFTLGPTPHAT